tara:strand:- start:500 stop:709 length:210 start_codon:yes stop_codon:yes gene_type:complete
MQPFDAAWTFLKEEKEIYNPFTPDPERQAAKVAREKAQADRTAYLQTEEAKTAQAMEAIKRRQEELGIE